MALMMLKEMMLSVRMMIQIQPLMLYLRLWKQLMVSVLLSLLHLTKLYILHISEANSGDEAGDSHNDTRSVLLERNVESKHMIG